MLSEHARQLAERYDREAETYRELWAPVLFEASLPLVAELAGAGVEIGLDVGAGVGTLLPALRAASPEARWHLLDRSRGMLERVSAEAPRITADAARLPIRSACVDRVVMAFMLFHLERPLDGLIEARRVLRPGGRVGLITWGGELESAATRIWSESLDAHGAPPPDPAAAVRHEACDSPEKLERLLQSAGFSAVRAWRHELAIELPADRLIRLRTRMGAAKSRYDALAEPERVACVDRAGARMESLAPGDFVARGKIVYAVANVGGRR